MGCTLEDDVVTDIEFHVIIECDQRCRYCGAEDSQSMQVTDYIIDSPYTVTVACVVESYPRLLEALHSYRPPC